MSEYKYDVRRMDDSLVSSTRAIFVGAGIKGGPGIVRIEEWWWKSIRLVVVWV